MDGTIYKEDTVFDGRHQFLDYIEGIGGKYVFITNNSSKSVDDSSWPVRKKIILTIPIDFSIKVPSAFKILHSFYNTPITNLTSLRYHRLTSGRKISWGQV